VAYRIFAVPAHLLSSKTPVLTRGEDWLEPELPAPDDTLERALSGAEYRDIRARDRLRTLLNSDRNPDQPAPGEGFGPSAVLGRAPQDLPALIRLADQLDRLATKASGERAMVWRCRHCAKRYAVPLHLVRSVSIRCEGCENTVDLLPETALGEEALEEPAYGEVNALRYRLAAFIREAMARGWPILVSAALPRGQKAD